MALESAYYLNGLVAANPVPGDLVAQSDDHLRLIKQTLLNTFPALSSPVTQTAPQVNTAAPTGAIIMWAGSATQIPAGWAPCDGGTYTSPFSGLPVTTINLMGKLVAGAGVGFAPGSAGGRALNTSLSVDSSVVAGHVHTGVTDILGSHTHLGVTGGTSLSPDQLASHNHLSPLTLAQTGAIFAAGSALSAASFQGAVGYNSTSNNTGAGAAHTHTIAADGAHGHTVNLAPSGQHNHTSVFDPTPNYVALYFLQRL